MGESSTAAGADPENYDEVVNVNTVIIGGGHAGVNLACMLHLNNKEDDSDYIVLERTDSLLNKCQTLWTRTIQW